MAYTLRDLKSNMDRFIGGIIIMILAETIKFKIQYG